MACWLNLLFVTAMSFLRVLSRKNCSIYRETELLMGSAYHPQTDGQTEWVSRCVETYLRCFSGHQPKQWVHWLSWAEWCCNTSFDESIKMSPFEVVYGQSPPSVEAHVQGTTTVHYVEQELLK